MGASLKSAQIKILSHSRSGDPDVVVTTLFSKQCEQSSNVAIEGEVNGEAGNPR